MAFHDVYRTEFLSRPPTAEPSTILGNAADYDVQLQPANVEPGQRYWRVAGVHHLLPNENRSNRHVFVDVVDADGQRVRDANLRLHWGWEGQHPDENAPPKRFDKPDHEPHTNVDVYLGQHIWIRVDGDDLPSDAVTNLHTNHPDERGPAGQTWNSVGHHSFYVLFQRAVKRVDEGEDSSETGKDDETENDVGGAGGGEQPGDGQGEPEPDTPVVPDPPPLSTARGNKLGFYLHLSLDQHGLWEAIRRVQPPVILIHADTANKMLLQEIRRFRAPDAFVIGRFYKDNHTQRQMLDSADPAAQGRALADEILHYDFGLATARGENGRLLIDAWMSLNEAVPGPALAHFQERPAETARLLRNYDQFQVAFREHLHAAGVEAVAFNFAAGNFTEPAHYLEHFPATLQSYTYLGFHEYGWPTLYPAAGSATGAGLYRRCLDGIRARYGDRHRVIITEAGLTRMFQNPQWGDVGWLNTDAPLSEDEYWASLAWYNEQMVQDDYVLGACLYEVGHHGQWESFRHLGRDHQGRDLHLIDRIAALRDADVRGVVPPGADEGAAPATRTLPLDIRGTVTQAGFAVVGATVRLLGGAETLGGVHSAVLDAPSYVSWTRRITGVEDPLWYVWLREVAQEVAGISWSEFKHQMADHNPGLADDSYRLRATQTYWLPENRDIAVEIVWDRPLSGFDGSVWDGWQRFVQHKVVGLNYQQFKDQVTVHNPAVAEDGRFAADQRYNLPRNAGHKRYVLPATTNSRGRFAFENLPPGDYELRITAPGVQPYTTGFSCQSDVELDVLLLPVVAEGGPDDAPEETAGTRAVTREGATHDFVRVHNDEFVENGHTLRFVGVNIRGLVHYGDRATLPHSTPGHRIEQLQAAHEMGARVVRVFLPSMHAGADVTIERLRQVVTLVRERYPGLYILPAFANLYADVPFRIPGDDAFYRPIDPNWGGDLLAADFFTGGYSQNCLPFMRRVISAFADEPVIFAWEIGNELKLNPAQGVSVDDPHLNAFIDFMQRAAGLIRELDGNHLITTGLISTHHCWLHNAALQHRLYDSPLFDFLTVHCYNEEYINDDSGLARALHKPFIVEEAGFGNSYGSDRSGMVQQDMARWFNSGARGYLQWGFMATQHDMGDGDGDSGMDRSLHSDWEALFRVYSTRAEALEQQRQPVNVPDKPDKPARPVAFTTGATVYAHTVVNVRATPGHINHPADDVLGQIAIGAPATITGDAVTADNLVWWPIRATLTNGQTVNAWAAQSIPGQVLLSTAQPRRVLPRGLGVAPVG